MNKHEDNFNILGINVQKLEISANVSITDDPVPVSAIKVSFLDPNVGKSSLKNSFNPDSVSTSNDSIVIFGN